MSSSVLYDAIDPRGRRSIAIFTVLSGLGLAVLAALGLKLLHARGQLSGEIWAVLGNPDLLQLLLTGLRATLEVALAALVFSLLAGAVLAVGLRSGNRWIRLPLRAWMEVFRGLPLLLLIFFLYLGGPAVGIEISTFWSLVVGLTLYNSSVIAEIFRAGVLSLPRGQGEAALAVGMTGGQTLRLILLPQAVRRMLPSLLTQIVILLKETSFGFLIGYTELLREGRTAVEFLGGQYSLPVYTLLAAIYIVVNMALSMLARWLEKRS
jgi:glutamate transport system permease protein